MNRRYFFIPFLSIILLFGIQAPNAFAQAESLPRITGSQRESLPRITGQKITLVNPLGTTNLIQLLLRILDFVIYLGAIVIILMLVHVGYMFVIARGAPNKIGEARQALLWTVVGALILLGSKAISIGICETARALSTGGSIVSCSVF